MIIPDFAMESLQFARGKESNAFSSSSSSSFKQTVCHGMQKSIQLEKLRLKELSDYSQRPQNRDRLGWDRHNHSNEAINEIARIEDEDEDEGFSALKNDSGESSFYL